MKWKLILENSIDLDNLVLNIVDDDLVEEGAGKAITYGLLAFLLGSSGIVEGAEFKRGILHLVQDKKVQQGKVTITKSELKDVVDKAKTEVETVGKWELTKAKNLLARTLYMESREDGIEGLNMSMTVIWNRAGKGMKDQFVSECLRPYQFSCWNDKPSSDKNPTTYQIQFPKCVETGKGKDFRMWNECVKIAESAYNGTFKPVNEKWNAYYNPEKCSPSWASKLIDAKTVGHHIVGELKDQTQHAINLKKSQKPQSQKTQIAKSKPLQGSKIKMKNYTVQSGDSLWTIAGKNMGKVNQIKELNGLTSDVIKPG